MPIPVDQKVSIITPAFNAAATIDATIHSVLRQTYGNWELIIVDDGSTDDTAERVMNLAASNPQIRLIQQKNSGPAAARQKGIDSSKGRYIAFLDSDDCWLPDKLTMQLEFMDHNNVALSYTNFRRFDVRTGAVGREIQCLSDATYRQLLQNTTIATSTVMIDVSMTGTLKLRDTYYDDFALWLDLLKAGNAAKGLNSDLMRYAVSSNSVSGNKLKSARKVWTAMREEQGLSFFSTGYFFVFWAINAVIKHMRF